jgi:hypothetical protein
MCDGCNTEENPTITPETAAEMVADGSAFLTQHDAKGWFNLINLDRLSVRSGSYCIGGQLHGDWFDFRDFALDKGVDYEELCSMGFDDPGMNNYTLLDDAWRTEIVRLRELDAA